MAKFEIEFSKRETVIVEAETEDEAYYKVFNFMEAYWFTDDAYRRYGMEAARDEDGCCIYTNEIVSIKELPEAAPILPLGETD